MTSPLTPTPTPDDIVLPFLVNNTHLRGRVARLHQTLNTILTKHAYPEPVSRLLGELVVLVSMLGDTLKCEGIITLQAQTDGLISLLVADYTKGGKLRGYARLKEDRYNALDKAAQAALTFEDLLGKGYLVLTLDQGQDSELYQGIVELAGNDLCECVENYFRQSEQLPTVLRIAIGQVYDGTDGGMEWRGGGIMVQSLPSSEEPSSPAANDDFDEQWNKAKIFIESVKPEELIDPLISPDNLLMRLFHEEGVWKYDAHSLEHSCRCTREKAMNILKSLSTEELNSLKINDEIVVTCQFCNREQVFTEKMLEEEE